ncbi:MAG TPA: hypothetical protein PLI51_10520 [bacterium]|nr:hypothetical protein [bacterium]HPQ67149.1 hypothetical protein [bacterium]
MLGKIAAIVCLFVVLASAARAEPPGGWGRYNPGLKRVEYFDRQGALVGFSRFNPTLNRMEFFDRRNRVVGWARRAPNSGRIEYYPARSNARMW